jgi:hypothetical protein
MSIFNLKIESLGPNLSLNDINVDIPFGKTVWITSDQAKRSQDFKVLVQKGLLKVEAVNTPVDTKNLLSTTIEIPIFKPIVSSTPKIAKIIQPIEVKPESDPSSKLEGQGLSEESVILDVFDDEVLNNIITEKSLQDEISASGLSNSSKNRKSRRR